MTGHRQAAAITGAMCIPIAASCGCPSITGVLHGHRMPGSEQRVWSYASTFTVGDESPRAGYRRRDHRSGTRAGRLSVGRRVRGYGYGLGVPDVAVVVADGPVGGEEARAGRVQDRHPGPPVLVGPGGPDGLVVAVDVGPVIGQDQVLVPAEDGGEDLLGCLLYTSDAADE